MKKLLSIFSILCLSFTIFNMSGEPIHAQEEDPYQTEMNTIKDRLKEYFFTLDTIDDGAKVEAVYVSKARDYLDSINADGSWSDVDYTARDSGANGRPWSPYLALDRMQALAFAYSKPDHELYHDANTLNALNNALLHWKSAKPSSTNWWENDIGVNLRFSRIGLFLEKDLNADSLQVIINSLNKEGKYHGTGQNNLWYDQNSIYRALITNDGTQLKKVIEECLSYILILQTDNTTLEALQVDNSLYFHGTQFYSNGYGLSMFRDMSFWIYMLRDTHFALGDDVVKRMSDYMLDGTRWTIRGDIAELYLGYRPYKFDVNYKNYADEYVVPLQRMMAVDTSRADEYQKVLDNIEGSRKDNGTNGHNYMWRVGYDSHMRDGYGVNIKMDSKRIIGGEWRGAWPKDNDQGNLIYWSSSATSTILVDGDEYTSVYPTYDWKHNPGATTPNEIHKGYANYGRFTNGTDHTIGVSNGTYGSTSYVMDKSSTQATKSYFMFDNEVVALGSGITSTNKNEIHTTLNQVKAEGTLVDGNTISDGTRDEKTNGKWIYNGKVGYVFLENTDFEISNSKQEDMPSLWEDKQKEDTPATFTAKINHGVSPKNDSYAYIILPNKTSSEVASYANAQEVSVISNTKDVQAVRHDGLKITQVNFFKATQLEYAPGKTISVDQACNVIIDESGATRKISVALTDTDYNKTVSVDINDNGKKSTTKFVVSPAPYTGKTMTLQEGQSNTQEASSSVASHEAMYAYDNDMNTYWKSDTNEDQWITRNLNGSTFVSKATINWNTNYATSFKLQGSDDGVNYYDISDVITNTSDTSIVDVNRVTSYVRIVMISSNNHQGYEIKEIKLDAGINIALKKDVEVSSTSATDTGNVATNAVDGNSSTRWSSARNSDNEWILVDFNGTANINALIVNWEGARSSKYTVEVSNDKENWTSVKTIESPSSLVDTIVFDKEVSGKYLRLNSTKSAQSKYGISIFELEVYGSVKQDETPEVPENIALHKPAEASSSYKNPYSGFVLEPKYAFDGSIENKGDTFQSRWVSQRNSNDEWILVDLEDTYNLDSVVLNWEGACAKEYKLFVSTDKENWTDVFTETDGKAGIKKITFDSPVQARYVKMQGIVPATKYGYSLWEFEVYGTPTQPSVDKQELQELIDSTSSLQEDTYTSESWNALQTAITSATTVLNDTEATQSDVDNAVTQLQSAISNLKKKPEAPDKSELAALIDSVSTLKAEDYTETTWSEFSLALTLANATLNNTAATQEQIATAITTLQSAVSNLSQIISGLQDTYTVELNETLYLNVAPAEGTWEYDSTFFEEPKMKAFSSGSIVLKAIKVGDTSITYTTNKGESKTVQVSISKKSDTPKSPNKPGSPNSPTTGDTTTLMTFTVLALLSIIAVAFSYKKKYKK